LRRSIQTPGTFGIDLVTVYYIIQTLVGPRVRIGLSLGTTSGRKTYAPESLVWKHAYVKPVMMVVMMMVNDIVTKYGHTRDLSSAA